MNHNKTLLRVFGSKFDIFKITYFQQLYFIYNTSKYTQNIIDLIHEQKGFASFNVILTVFF